MYRLIYKKKIKDINIEVVLYSFNLRCIPLTTLKGIQFERRRGGTSETIYSLTAT